MVSWQKSDGENKLQLQLLTDINLFLYLYNIYNLADDCLKVKKYKRHETSGDLFLDSLFGLDASNCSGDHYSKTTFPNYEGVSGSDKDTQV